MKTEKQTDYLTVRRAQAAVQTSLGCISFCDLEHLCIYIVPIGCIKLLTSDFFFFFCKRPFNSWWGLKDLGEHFLWYKTVQVSPHIHFLCWHWNTHKIGFGTILSTPHSSVSPQWTHLSLNYTWLFMNSMRDIIHQLKRINIELPWVLY